MQKLNAFGFEPELHEVMRDPIIQLLMKKDGVRQEKLLPVLDSVRRRLEGTIED